MTFRIVQNDTAPSITSQLTDGGKPIDLSTASNITFHMEDMFQRSVVSDDLTGRTNIVDPTIGKVEYTWRAEDTDTVGTYSAEWEVLYEDGKVETFPTSDNKITIEVVEGINND